MSATGATPTRARSAVEGMDETRVDLSLDQTVLDSTPQLTGEPSAKAQAQAQGGSSSEQMDVGEGTSRQIAASIEIDQIEAGPSSECNLPAIMITDAGQNGMYNLNVLC